MVKIACINFVVWVSFWFCFCSDIKTMKLFVFAEGKKKKKDKSKLVRPLKSIFFFPTAEENS